MKPKGSEYRAQPRASSEPPATPLRKKRFHVEKLEERIAPKKPSGGGGQTSSGWSVVSASIY